MYKFGLQYGFFIRVGDVVIRSVYKMVIRFCFFDDFFNCDFMICMGILSVLVMIIFVVKQVFLQEDNKVDFWVINSVIRFERVNLINGRYECFLVMQFGCYFIINSRD